MASTRMSMGRKECNARACLGWTGRSRYGPIGRRFLYRGFMQHRRGEEVEVPRSIPAARLFWAALGVGLGGCAGGEPVGGVCDLLPGDVVISEVMANPLGSSDSNGEWFELYNPSDEPKLLD